MDVALILLAAGSSRRFGGDIPKQYLEVAGQCLLLHCLHALAREPRFTMLQPVIAADDSMYADVIAEQTFPFKLLPSATGGGERAESMQCGLRALPDSVDWVAVHDAARPIPSQALLKQVLDMAFEHGAAVPGIAVNDTIKRIDDAGQVMQTLDRSRLRAVQTPQVGRRDWFEDALLSAEQLHMHTDDASLLEAAGYPVYISEGDSMNRKITTVEDMAWLQRMLMEQPA
ncbi:MAG: 2-C-methyl-D-erythritol 4-phosphate cytidylyltransferase [Mariprofundaceae bacterium]